MNFQCRRRKWKEEEATHPEEVEVDLAEGDEEEAVCRRKARARQHVQSGVERRGTH